MRDLLALIEAAMGKVYFHVTPSENVPGILEHGLVPQSGPRSQKLKDHGIYLFDSEGDAEDALMNWLGDEFEDDVQLTLLRVTLPSNFKLHQEAFEYVAMEPILPECIQIENANL